MPVRIADLDETAKGKYVRYRYSFTTGRITSWNHDYVFVVYACDGDWEHYEQYTAQATHPEDLTWA
jgi:hypothetical protein